MNGNTIGFLQKWFLFLCYFLCQIISSDLSLAAFLTLQDALLHFRIKKFLCFDLLCPWDRAICHVWHESNIGDSYFAQKWRYRGGILSVLVALCHMYQVLPCSLFVTNYKLQTFHRFLPMLILILYFVKQTWSVVNIAQDSSEMLLQPHIISYLLSLQMLKISTL